MYIHLILTNAEETFFFTLKGISLSSGFRMAAV